MPTTHGATGDAPEQDPLRGKDRGGLNPLTGFYHIGAREYDPRTACWLQRDPIEASSGDPNFWRYCGNDPVNFTDSSGEAPQWVHGSLDLIGWVPVIGEIADGVNAGLYALDGDLENAGISLLGVIPIVGDAGKLGRTGKRIYDFASNALRSDRVYERGGAKVLRLFRDNCGSRREAFRTAKEKAGIPKSQQPVSVSWERINDQPGYVVGRVYEFKREDGARVIIKEHSLGHPQYGLGAHFNTYVFDKNGTKIPLIGNANTHTFFPRRRGGPKTAYGR